MAKGDNFPLNKNPQIQSKQKRDWKTHLKYNEEAKYCSQKKMHYLFVSTSNEDSGALDALSNASRTVVETWEKKKSSHFITKQNGESETERQRERKPEPWESPERRGASWWKRTSME